MDDARRRLLLPLLFILTVGCIAGLEAQRAPTIVPAVDHHQHLLSPALAKAWSIDEAVTPERLIAQLDAAGIRRALVLSLAYAYGSASIRGADEVAQVRAENDWTGQQAARYPDRLRAFCSVNPLREYALAEIERCSRDPNLRRGLKLHLANSGVNFRKADDVRRVREAFRAANDRGMAIVVHVWTGDDKVGNPYDGRDARTFLNDVLPAAPDIPVQIAHLGGSGPRLDAGTKEGISVLAEAAASPRAFGRSACDASSTVPIWRLAETRRRRTAGPRTWQSSV